ncbi:MAG: hypothetical protein R3F37_13280 [Candidatus Competibacteraceae bacterium]
MKTRRRVRIVSGRLGLDSLRGDWQSLTDNWPEAPFYVLYDWYWAYLHYLEDDPENNFVVLEDESGCRGILPLRRERHSTSASPGYLVSAGLPWAWSLRCAPTWGAAWRLVAVRDSRSTARHQLRLGRLVIRSVIDWDAPDFQAAISPERGLQALRI